MERVESRSSTRVCSWTTSFQYLNDLPFLSEFPDVHNFADDTPFYVCDMDLNSLLEHDSFLVIESFDNNMKSK